MTRQTLNVHLLPRLVKPAQMTGKAAVVIDVLRATTTIVHALAAGATAVIPCREVEEARRLAGARGDVIVLGGERGGLQIEGFHLGNSPAEYTPETVGGKTVIFTTTNGTRAMLKCRLARRVLVGAFVNFSALCDILSDEAGVELLCAGTNREVTREDVLLAGAVAAEVAEAGDWLLNDQARIAADAWSAVSRDLATTGLLWETLKESRGGQNLQSIGQAKDIEIAAQIDKFDRVPELNVPQWIIR